MPPKWRVIVRHDFWTVYHASEEINGVMYEWMVDLPEDPLPDEQIPDNVRIWGELAFKRTKEKLNGVDKDAQ